MQLVGLRASAWVARVAGRPLQHTIMRKVPDERLKRHTMAAVTAP